MQAGKTHVNSGNANANASRKCKRKEWRLFRSLCSLLHLRLRLRYASSHVCFLAFALAFAFAFAFASHVWTGLNANASTNASKRSVTCPPSWKKEFNCACVSYAPCVCILRVNVPSVCACICIVRVNQILSSYKQHVIGMWFCDVVILVGLTYTSLSVVVIPWNIDSIAIQRSGNSPWKYKGANMKYKTKGNHQTYSIQNK